MVNKFIVAAVGTVANLLAAGLIPDQYVPYAVAVVSALTAAGVYVVPNNPAPLSKSKRRFL